MPLGVIRSRVEGVFGTLKRTYRRHRLLYRGIARNSLHLFLTLLTMKLPRARVLCSA